MELSARLLSTAALLISAFVSPARSQAGASVGAEASAPLGAAVPAAVQSQFIPQASALLADLDARSLEAPKSRPFSADDAASFLARSISEPGAPAARVVAGKAILAVLASPGKFLPGLAGALRRPGSAGSTDAGRRVAKGLAKLAKTYPPGPARKAIAALKLDMPGSLDVLFDGLRMPGASGAEAVASEDHAKRSPIKLNPSGSSLLQKLMPQPFLDPKYSRPFLSKLIPITGNGFSGKIGWKAGSPGQLAALAEKFEFPADAGSKLGLRLQLMEHSKQEDPHVILLGIFYRKDGAGTPAGYFCIEFKNDKKGELEAEVDGVYLDKQDGGIRGMAPAILAFLGANVYPEIRVRKEVLKADHAGRYVWAMQGFQFDPNYWFKDVDNGKPYKLWEIAQKNFSRFLRAHGIRAEDLVTGTSGGAHPVGSVQDLKTPADFAGARHKRGKKVKVRPFILGVLEAPVDLDVGKAFMLSSYLPEGCEFIMSMARAKFSPRAMPYWNGYRSVGPSVSGGH